MPRRRLVILLALVAILLLAGAGGALTFGGLPLPQAPAGRIWMLHDYVSNGAEVALPSGRSPTVSAARGLPAAAGERKRRPLRFVGHWFAALRHTRYGGATAVPAQRQVDPGRGWGYPQRART
jgi:hypothetical protein